MTEMTASSPPPPPQDKMEESCLVRLHGLREEENKLITEPWKLGPSKKYANDLYLTFILTW